LPLVLQAIDANVVCFIGAPSLRLILA